MRRDPACRLVRRIDARVEHDSQYRRVRRLICRGDNPAGLRRAAVDQRSQVLKSGIIAGRKPCAGRWDISLRVGTCSCTIMLVPSLPADVTLPLEVPIMARPAAKQRPVDTATSIGSVEVPRRLIVTPGLPGLVTAGWTFFRTGRSNMSAAIASRACRVAPGSMPTPGPACHTRRQNGPARQSGFTAVPLFFSQPAFSLRRLELA